MNSTSWSCPCTSSLLSTGVIHQKKPRYNCAQDGTVFVHALRSCEKHVDWANLAWHFLALCRGSHVKEPRQSFSRDHRQMSFEDLWRCSFGRQLFHAYTIGKWNVGMWIPRTNEYEKDWKDWISPEAFLKFPESFNHRFTRLDLSALGELRACRHIHNLHHAEPGWKGRMWNRNSSVLKFDESGSLFAMIYSNHA